MKWSRAIWTAAMIGYGPLLAACAHHEASVAPAATPAPSPAKNEIYVVIQRGQTLDAVAAKFNVPKAEIIALNDLKPPYRLKPGGILKLPLAAAQLNPEKQVDEEPVTRKRPPRPAATATTTASPTAAPERARRPSRPKTSEKSTPPPPQVIPLD